MNKVILHHYPSSPYSEKVRLAFGWKGIEWLSVKIPIIMPKPDLIALTGGYRKTPVMQIGADIYCDSACMLRALERLHPERTLYPSPLAEAFSGWVEAKIFNMATGIVFAHAGETYEQSFKEDRAKFSGRDFSIERMRAALPYMMDQTRAVLLQMDQLLAQGGPFLFGAGASVADFGAYHPLWFIVARLGKPVPPLTEFPRVLDWMQRVQAIGHGQRTNLTSAEAIDIARNGTPAAAPGVDPQDPANRKPGDKVSVMPDDTGREPTVGELVGSNAQEIVIRRTDERAGTVHVHFPRLGFSVTPAK